MRYFILFSVALAIFLGPVPVQFDAAKALAAPAQISVSPKTPVVGQPVTIRVEGSYRYIYINVDNRWQRTSQITRTYQAPGNQRVRAAVSSGRGFEFSDLTFDVQRAASPVPRFEAKLVFQERFCSYRHYNEARDLNNLGQVVGVSKNCNTGQYETYLYDANTEQTRILLEMKLAPYGTAAINNNGLVAGSDQNGKATVYDTQTNTAIPLRCTAFLKFINDQNITGGGSMPAAGCTNLYEPVLWRSLPGDPTGQFAFLGPLNPGDFMSSALLMNNQGTVVGYSNPDMGVNYSLFLYHDATGKTRLTQPPDYDAMPSAINDAGQIVGSQKTKVCTTAGGVNLCQMDAIIWEEGSSRVLFTQGSAADINAAGWVVGTRYVDVQDPSTGKVKRTTFPVLMTPDGEVHKIADLIEGGLPSYSDPTGPNRLDPATFLTSAGAINDQNQIIVSRIGEASVTKFTYILIPIP